MGCKSLGLITNVNACEHFLWSSLEEMIELPLHWADTTMLLVVSKTNAHREMHAAKNIH